MTDGDLSLKIDAALAERLRKRAEAAGLGVEEYALDILGREAMPPGLEDNEAQWNGAVDAPYDNGFDEGSEAYADYIDRICDEAERTGGVPFEVFRDRLRNLGQRR